LKITITRPFNGIGDWLFALGCITQVNRQRPDVEVYVDFSKARGLPPIVPELYRLSDARFTEGCPADSLVTHDSLVYRKRPPELFLESTLQHLADQTGLELKYEHGTYPSFGVAHESRGYVAMIGHGKRRIRAGKEWGFENFSALACLLLDSGYEVVQIGADNDWRLPRASQHVMSESAETVLKVLAGARLFIGIENGLMVLSGYLRIPQITIYDGNGYPTRVDFDKQVKLTRRTEPADVLETVRGLHAG
jgi:hypothetical protein